MEKAARLFSRLACVFAQLTSANGALCIINPLYIHDHGDDWLTHGATNATQLSASHRQRFANRPVMDPGTASKRPLSLNPDPPPGEKAGEFQSSLLTLCTRFVINPRHTLKSFTVHTLLIQVWSGPRQLTRHSPRQGA